MRDQADEDSGEGHVRESESSPKYIAQWLVVGINEWAEPLLLCPQTRVENQREVREFRVFPTHLAEERGENLESPLTQHTHTHTPHLAEAEKGILDWNGDRSLAAKMWHSGSHPNRLELRSRIV